MIILLLSTNEWIVRYCDVIIHTQSIYGVNQFILGSYVASYEKQDINV